MIDATRSLPTPYYQRDGQTLYHGDALDILPHLPPVDLILVDPPYYKVKGEWWDRQWDKPAEFLEWIGRLCDEWQRVLKPNGSLYVFASPQMAWGVEGEVRKRFDVLQRVTWDKAGGVYPPGDRRATAFRAIDVAGLRKFLPHSEVILFAEHFNAAGRLLRAARREQHLSSNEIGRLFPSANGGATGAVRNWELGLNTPSQQQWDAMRTLLPLPQYTEAVRPFNATPDRPYTDVWTFPTVQDYPGKHPCEKPLAMLEHIIETSTREGATVLDCCMGSGNTLRAARNYGRQGIGIDVEKKWCRRAKDRLTQRSLPFGPDTPEPAAAAELITDSVGGAP